MFRYLIIAVLSLFLYKADAQRLKPYILAGYSNDDIVEVKNKVIDKLKTAGIKVAGSYNPLNSKQRVLIAITDDNLTKAVKKTGGFRGFALALRVALTNENNKIMVTYTNPEYWGRAYFQKQWDNVSSYYSALDKKLRAALSGFEGDTFVPFGSKKGVKISKLKKYHYMIGMPYFKDNITLNTFDSHQNAVSTIENNLKNNANLKKVYKISLPDKNMTLFGIGLLGPKGEKHFMPKIDVSSPKHTAFLPYELLVLDNKAYMLHGRFRIALSFPDLSMGQFMKISSTPGYIKDRFKEICK